MKKLLNQLFRLILTFWVFLYVVFEELIWDSVAEPIYNYVRQLRLLQAIESRVNKLKPISVLILFLILFVQVEGLGILALALMAQGNPVFGIALYLAKLPVAAFTFWLFRVCKDTLMTFAWFKYSYEALERLIAFIKASDIHQHIIGMIVELKNWLKSHTKIIRQTFSSAKTALFKYMGFHAN